MSEKDIEIVDDSITISMGDEEMEKKKKTNDNKRR